MHAGFQFIVMTLDAEAGPLHEIGGEKTRDGLHDPRMLFGITVAEPEFDRLVLLVGTHTLIPLLASCRTVPISPLRLPLRSV